MLNANNSEHGSDHTTIPSTVLWEQSLNPFFLWRANHSQAIENDT
jgi:hypothetical protein